METADLGLRNYHTGYLTDDLQGAVDFYVNALGGRVTARTFNGASEIAFVSGGGFEVELIAPVDRGRLGGRSGLVLDHVGYFVEDLDRAIEVLTGRGVRFTSAPALSGEGHRSVFIEPSCSLGAKIHISQAPMPAGVRTGEGACATGPSR